MTFASQQDLASRRRLSQQKEPFILHDVPSGPWEKVGIGLFQNKPQHYLLIAGYFRNFPLVRKHSNRTAAHVTSLLKTIFLGHGIPAYVFMGQGSKFKSGEFQDFARYYWFEILHSTPRYPQSYGFIEPIFKTVKQIISKAEQLGRLTSCSVSLQSHTKRFREALPSWCNDSTYIRALLPIIQHLSVQLTNSRETALQQKLEQAEHHNCTTQQLQEIQQDQSIWVQLDPG